MKKYLIMAVLLKCSLVIYSQKLTSLVDPFLGTGGHGHVYPGATVPFGMVQLSPDNGVEGWDWCGGYHYSSNTIAGFSHTHLSGTGIGDWCDISVLPLNDTMNIRKEKILIPFSHSNEKANPGYYQVKLDNNIQCAFTATERNGYHQYSFPNKTGWLRFDMGFRINWDKSTEGMLQIVDDYTIVGYRYSTGWAKGQKVYFAAKFSTKISNHIFIDDSLQTNKKGIGKNVKLALQFNTSNPLFVRVGLSSVSTEKALISLNETKQKSFNEVVKKADTLWEVELQKIKITAKNKQQAQQFYTALYRTCLAPVIHSDKDGAYQTHDNRQLRFTRGKKNTQYFLNGMFSGR